MSFAITLLSNFSLSKPDAVTRLSHQWAKAVKHTPKKSEILSVYRQLVAGGELTPNPDLEKALRTRQVRSRSGVVPFAVMTKPFNCPGLCTYCPLELGMPKSYLSDEPAAQRAKSLDFDPEKQIAARLKQLSLTGHHTDKIEVIVIGGTFSAYPDDYKISFFKGIFDAVNQHQSRDLKEAHLFNETASRRIVGISVETRPDWVTPKEVILFRRLGVTKVQLGVQAFDEQILKKIRRGHSLNSVAQATLLLRNAGFKICYHFMPNLPLSSPGKDLRMAKIMYRDPRFKPDFVKIYPCVVIPGTELHRQWQAKEYVPYSDENLYSVLLDIKKITPPTVRIDRLVRDISKSWVASGPVATNLRQALQQQLAIENSSCRCIRCREIKEGVYHQKPSLIIRRYRTLGGTEFFLSYEKDGKLFSLLRLRLPEKGSQTLFPELEGAALIREVHTFGRVVPLSARQSGRSQHQGLGKKLIAKAEQIAAKNGYEKIAVISAVGTHQYYQTLGFLAEGLYLTKSLNKPTWV